MFKGERQEQYQIEIDYDERWYAQPFRVYFSVVNCVPVLKSLNGARYSLFELEQMTKLLKKKIKEYEELNK